MTPTKKSKINADHCFSSTTGGLNHSSGSRDDVEELMGPSPVKDPKLWIVQCDVGFERKLAIDFTFNPKKPAESKIISAIALDTMRGYILVEARELLHVKQAVKGMDHANQCKIRCVPLNEMVEVLSSESKTGPSIRKGDYVRMDGGIYHGDLAKIVDFDAVLQKATVKLIPRIDFLPVANEKVKKGSGRKKMLASTAPPLPRILDVNEARKTNIEVGSTVDTATGDTFDVIGGQKFKDGFLYEKVSVKWLVTQNVKPTIDELEKFGEKSPSDIIENLNKVRFVKGDCVVVVEGGHKGSKGIVEKVTVDKVIMNVKPSDPQSKSPSVPLVVGPEQICKHFRVGTHVRVVCGSNKCTTGMIATVKDRTIDIIADQTLDMVSVSVNDVEPI